MNQVPAIIQNPAHVEEPESDGDVDPADITPFISGNAPIVTVPASEDEEADGEVVADGAEGGRGEMADMYNFLGELSEKIQTFNSTMQGSTNPSQPPVVPDTKLWDTELAWEREFNLYPDISRSVVISRLYNQVWNLLHKMKERVTRQTWKIEDQEIVEGLIDIMILSARNNILTDQIIKDHAEKP